MQRTEVSFLSGEILRKEMLQDMYEYPRVIMEGYYSGYSDGILYGLNWKDAEKSGHHIITPGALKLHGKIYFLANPLDVEECFDSLSGDTRYRLFFLENDQVQCQPSRKIYNLDLQALKSGDVEKVRDEGFYYAYVNFTVEGGFRFIRDDEQLYGLYAAVNGGRDAYSLPPYWLEKDILPILTDKQERHPFDYELMRMIYSGDNVPVSFLAAYIHEYERNSPENTVELNTQVAGSGELFERFKKAVEKLHGEKIMAEANRTEKMYKEESDPDIGYGSL